MKNLAKRFDNSSIPIALKWSMILACFVSVIMGLLAWFLIDQQRDYHRDQNQVLGRMVVDQLARAASEPLLAQDNLTLNVLVQQEEKDDLIIGMQIFNSDGKLLASAGISAIWDIRSLISGDYQGEQLNWQTPDTQAVTFYSAIEYQGVTAGLALVTIDRQPLEARITTLTHALAMTTIGLIVVGAMLAFPLAHKLSAPIQQLVKVGEAIDSGETRTLIIDDRKDEIGRVLGTFRHLADGMEKKREVESAFSRFVSPSIAKQVLTQPEGGQLGGTTTYGSVLFCDVVGFTELSEDLAPAEVGGLLNQYFKYFSIAAHASHGTVDKFIGDCIMVLFGVPDPDEQHALHAVTCAALIQQIAARINYQRHLDGLPIVQFRIGVNSGAMLAGNLGSEDRMQYTVVGDVVNLTARICDICEPGQILTTKETLNQPGLEKMTQPLPIGAIRVKGRKQPVTPYRIDAAHFSKLTDITALISQIFPTESEI